MRIEPHRLSMYIMNIPGIKARIFVGFSVLLVSLLSLAALMWLHKPSATKINTLELRALLNYGPFEVPPPSVIIFEPESRKKLIYVATEHINSSDHPIAHEIKRIMECEKPDFCILEGFDMWEGVNAPRIVSLAQKMFADGRFAENLYAAFLCKQYNIDFIGGDPRESIYLEPLSRLGFSEEDVVFTLLAQNFPYWNRDNRTSTVPLKQLVESMIQDIAHWLEKERLEYTYEDFLRWHEKHMGKPFDMQRDFPWGYNQKELTPSVMTDASIYQKVLLHTMAIRDLHIITTMHRQLKTHNCVMVMFGASHYEYQKAALERLFGKPKSRCTVYRQAVGEFFLCSGG